MRLDIIWLDDVLLQRVYSTRPNSSNGNLFGESNRVKY
jgi:hypothetical protein